MDRPLTGIRVIALEQYMAGPYCSMLLADAGAEVIKIERPQQGDPRRAIPPFAEKNGKKMGAGFMAYNRNKKSVVLDLKDPAGRAVYRDLVATADVVVENLRPGSVDRIKETPIFNPNRTTACTRIIDQVKPLHYFANPSPHLFIRNRESDKPIDGRERPSRI